MTHAGHAELLRMADTPLPTATPVWLSSLPCVTTTKCATMHICVVKTWWAR